MVNACILLEVEVIKCNAHRLNSATMWALGIYMRFRQEVRKPGDGKADEETGGACRGI